MTATRGRILDYLNIRGNATSNEISHALGITTADARHHLAILIDEGAVKFIGKRRGRGRGRPAHVYAVTTQVHRHNLDKLSCALLDEFVAPTEEKNRSKAFKRLSTRLLGAVEGGGNLSLRLYRSVEKLNELNYQAHWEAHATAPRLILGHCPYAPILETHPEMCQIDAAMLEALTDASVHQAGKLVLDDRGARQCIFEVLE